MRQEYTTFTTRSKQSQNELNEAGNQYTLALEIFSSAGVDIGGDCWHSAIESASNSAPPNLYPHDQEVPT